MVRGKRNLDAETSGARQPTPQAIGEALFQALFAGQVGLLWARSGGGLPDHGLRLQLRFKLDEQPPGASILHSLPWELLRQPDTRDYLALSRLTPIIRYLEVPRPLNPLRRPSVLRILVVISAPTDLPSLNLSKELREVQQAWDDRPGVEVDLLERPWTGALREALLRRPYHVLHFIGHGELDSRTGEGLLFFEDQGGGADPVSGQVLATLLQDRFSLRLVFLNACETARAVRAGGLDPFAGVATALVMAGLPAVVAMQLPISDAAAIVFSRAVHLRLAAGDPLDVALAEGRQAILAANHHSTEWAIPVLFSRVSDGRIFDRSEVRDPEARSHLPPVPWKRRLGAGLATAFGLLLCVFLLRVLVDPDLVDRALSAIPRGTGRPKLERVQVGSTKVGRFEVTQREYRRFVLANPQWRRDRIAVALEDGDYLKPWISATEYPAELDDHPVTWVSWYAAQAFCEWVGGRLPRQAEWQAAAHAAESRFPWGSTRPAGSPPLNFCDRSCLSEHRESDPDLVADGFPETSPVGSFSAGRSGEGVFDLSGNVWEWTGEVSGSKRATLGGSYLAQFDECSTDRPVWEEARLCAPDGGFRCLWE